MRRSIQLLLATTMLSAGFLAATPAPTLAGGTHADVDYPPVEVLEQTPGENRGGFARLFRLNTPLPAAPGAPQHRLLPHPSSRLDLVRLGDAMIAPEGSDPATGEMSLAYVFLGQFIDHDLTLDTVTSFDEIADFNTLENARTVDLDLDCVYGGGPERTPYLYNGAKLRTGALLVNGGTASPSRHDLFRVPVPTGNAAKVALIGDPRNDENFVISQLQAAFIAYHNRMVDLLFEARRRPYEQLAERLTGELVRTAERRPRDRASPAASSIDAKAFAEAVASPSRLPVQAQSAPSTPDEGVIALFAATEFDNALREMTNRAAPGKAQLRRIAQETARAATDSFFAQQVENNAAEIVKVRDEARALTIHHYHRLILEDFLPRIITAERVQDILEKGRNFYFPGGFQDESGRPLEPFIPIEFAVAAYRFGHSQVPGRLRLRNAGTPVNATLFGTAGAKAGDYVPLGFQPMRSVMPRADGTGGASGPQARSMALDWRYLVALKTTSAPFDPATETGEWQLALRLDTELAGPLSELAKGGIVPPGALDNLASRNLSRGRTYLLPSGQDLARLIVVVLRAQDSLAAYGFEDPSGVSIDDLVLPPDARTLETLVPRETPLWYYILQEAAQFGTAAKVEPTQNGGTTMSTGAAEGITIPRTLRRLSEDETQEAAAADAADPQAGLTLGPVGGTIVGEVLVGLIDHYRAKTGHGIDLNVSLGGQTPTGDEPLYEVLTDEVFARPPSARPFLTETVFALPPGGTAGEASPGGERRYLLRNFLFDAGVADPITDEAAVCASEEHLPSTSC